MLNAAILSSHPTHAPAPALRFAGPPNAAHNTQALRTTEALKPGADTALDAATLEAIAGDAPSAQLGREVVAGQLLVDVAAAAGLLGSKGEVRRLIKNGGVYLNNQRVADDKAVIGEGDLIEGKLLLLAAGKKNKMLLRVE